MEIRSILASCISEMETAISVGNKIFSDFEKKFKRKFPINTHKRGSSEALVWALFDTALSLCYMGQNAALLVELYGLLEHFAMRDIPSFLSKNKNSYKIISSLIERKTLSEFSEILFDIKIWNKTDIAFIKKLTKIRNGITHKNSELLSKHLGNGKNLFIGDAENLVNKIDSIEYIIQTIDLLRKLSVGKISKKES